MTMFKIVASYSGVQSKTGNVQNRRVVINSPLNIFVDFIGYFSTKNVGNPATDAPLMGTISIQNKVLQYKMANPMPSYFMSYLFTPSRIITLCVLYIGSKSNYIIRDILLFFDKADILVVV